MLKTEIITRVCGILAKRELFKDIQFPVNRYFEDLATYYKILLKSNRVAINDAKLYNYRLTNNSITMSYSPKKCKDFILSTNEMINEITNKYKELNELANIVKIYNYVDAITMINKKEDIELYSEINKYLKSQKKFIKANYKFFNKKVKMKIKLYFFNIHFLKFCMNIYRNKRKYL